MINILLNAIGAAEGSRPGYWEGNPYDLTLGRGKYSKGFKPVSQLTLKEVKALQDHMVTHGAVSSAVGKYQFIRKTLKRIQDKLNVSQDEIFSNEIQDKFAIELLDERGLQKFLGNTMSSHTFMKNISKEWASLPNPNTGKSYYGQRCHYTVEQMKEVLNNVYRR